MASPTARARTLLDDYIKQLAQLGDGLTLEDFRTVQVEQALRTARIVRTTLWIFGFIFMVLALADLFLSSLYPTSVILWIGLWAFTLGGLGAISSIFLHVLKLVPEETIQISDAFEVVGRVFLGCLFSLVLALTFIPDEMKTFFGNFQAPTSSAAGQGGASQTEAASPSARTAAASASGQNPPASAGSIKLLLPFLCGYSIPLVLGLLQKAIRAVELTIGLDDRRDRSARSQIGRR